MIIAGWLLAVSRPAMAQEWQQMEAMPTARYGVAAVVWRNQILIIGGQDENGNSLRTVERYDPNLRAWSRFPDSLREARFNASAVVYRNRVYVIGGSRDHEILKSVEYFNEESGKWALLNELRFSREGAATAVINDRLYAIGGFAGDSTYLKNVEYYVPTLNDWKMGEWKLTLPRTSLAALAVHDSIFTIGGLYYGPVGIIERYHVSDGEQIRTNMPTPRGRLAAAESSDRIWVIGGSAQTGATNVVEIYDPQENAWYPGPSLIIARELHGAVEHDENAPCRKHGGDSCTYYVRW